MTASLAVRETPTAPRDLAPVGASGYPGRTTFRLCGCRSYERPERYSPGAFLTATVIGLTHRVGATLTVP